MDRDHTPVAALLHSLRHIERASWPINTFSEGMTLAVAAVTLDRMLTGPGWTRATTTAGHSADLAWRWSGGPGEHVRVELRHSGLLRVQVSTPTKSVTLTPNGHSTDQQPEPARPVYPVDLHVLYEVFARHGVPVERPS